MFESKGPSYCIQFKKYKRFVVLFLSAWWIVIPNEQMNFLYSDDKTSRCSIFTNNTFSKFRFLRKPSRNYQFSNNLYAKLI